MKFNWKINELYSYKCKTECGKNVNTYLHTKDRHLISKNEQNLQHNYNKNGKYVNEYQHVFRNSLCCKVSLSFNEELKPKE